MIRLQEIKKEFKIFNKKNVLIEPYTGIILNKNDKPYDLRFCSSFIEQKHFDYFLNQITTDLNKKILYIKKLNDTFFLNFQYNYAHTLIEILPKLFFLNFNKNTNISYNIEILKHCSEGLKQVLQLILDLFEFKGKIKEVKYDIITRNDDMPVNSVFNQKNNCFFNLSDTVFEIKNLFLYASDYYNLRAARYNFFKMSKYFWNYFYNSFFYKIKPFRKIFVYRTLKNQYQNSIRCLNQDEIYNFLKKYDFEKIEPNEMSVINQMKVFSEAKEVVGIHGAGLANIIFCQPKTKIVNINNFGNDKFFKNCTNDSDSYKNVMSMDKNKPSLILKKEQIKSLINV